MTTQPLQWTIDISAAASAPAAYSYEANEAELAALKRYAEIEDLTSFKANLTVAPLGAGKFKVLGKLHADAVQASVVDLSAVPACIVENFSVEYWPAELVEERGEEAVPFDEDAPESIVNGQIPIGALLCELLAVSLDPYPRNEGDEFEWAPQQEEAQSGPFANLAHLKPRDGTSGG